MEIYNKLKTPPPDAMNEIKGGRMKGKYDINVQWRIEKITEVFGICGIGWKIKEKEPVIKEVANNEVVIFITIDLFVKHKGEWSEPIPGHGGALLTSKEKNGYFNDDDSYKKAFSDALGNAMKYLGVAADVYRGMFDGKYSKNPPPPKSPSSNNFEARDITKGEVAEKWNGKIYKGNIVCIDNKKIVVSQEQINKLKTHEKYVADK